jgi:hypothetical protein
VVAAALAKAGRSVVILEAGPFSDEGTMPRAELDAFDRHYLDHGLTTTWDGSITMLAGTGVGGGTLINWMTCIDAPESVRRGWEREHGLEGVTGDAWAADVAAIESELGVAESTHIPPKDAILLRGARSLGWDGAATRRNATACGDCGSCGFGCRRGTKQSGIRVYLADASAAGARIVAGAKVSRVLIEGGVAVGVEAELTIVPDPAATTPQPPRRLLVHAPTVVLAAGALRTPAILQRSGLDHPAIGRHLRLHPVPVLAGRFDETVEMWRGTLQAARSLEFYRKASELQPNTPEYALGYGAALVQARRFAQAAYILRQVVKATPNDYVAHANLATALYESKRYQEAVPEYEWILTAKPEVVVAHYFIATAHDYLGEYPEALAAYEKFLAGAVNISPLGRPKAMFVQTIVDRPIPESTHAFCSVIRTVW